MHAARHPYHNTWGKLNAGQRYGLVAYDLDRALARAGLNKTEATLIQAIRERGWGTTAPRKARNQAWPDAAPRQLSLRGLAREIAPAAAENLRRELRKAKARLIADGLIVEQGQGLLINKQAHEWARLSADDVAYAVAAQPEARPGGECPHPPGGDHPHPPGGDRPQGPIRNGRASGDSRREEERVRDPPTTFPLLPAEEEEARRFAEEWTQHTQRKRKPHASGTTR